jgi:hypothetical protein
MQNKTQALEFRGMAKSQKNFFEISQTPVRYKDPFNDSNFNYYPNRKVIINNQLQSGISIVYHDFTAIKHEDAFDLGVTIFEMMFGVTPQIHRELLNERTTDYSVDLISEQCKIVFDNKGYRYVGPQDLDRADYADHESIMPNNQRITLDHIATNFHDEYFPFIRVSNYLREGNMFHIELGYYRYRCSNGMMMGRRTKMSFSSNYKRTSLGEIQQAAIDQFLHYKHEFLSMAERLWQLLSLRIPKAQIRMVAFDIFEKELLKKNIEQRKKLQLTLNELVEKYVTEIGENLNAALNVSTEFSKLLEGTRVSQSILQSLATQWMNRVTKRKFDLDQYLENLPGLEERVINARETEEIDEPVSW